MRAGLLPAAVFCLATGAALGCLFLLFKILRILLDAGKLCTALLDLLYCCLCGTAVFLCALAVDRGRPRLFQALLQGLGGWAAIETLDPFVTGAARRVEKFFRKVFGFFSRWIGIFAGYFIGKIPRKKKRRRKRDEKAKKAKKKT